MAGTVLTVTPVIYLGFLHRDIGPLRVRVRGSVIFPFTHLLGPPYCQGLEVFTLELAGHLILQYLTAAHLVVSNVEG